MAGAARGRALGLYVTSPDGAHILSSSSSSRSLSWVLKTAVVGLMMNHLPGCEVSVFSATTA